MSTLLTSHPEPDLSPIDHLLDIVIPRQTEN